MLILRHVPQRPGRAARGELVAYRTRAAVPSSLGRPLSNAAPNVTINLIAPGTLYGDRVNEFDVRFAKILKFGRTRTNVGFDLYNILNSAAVLSYNQTFNPTVSTGPALAAADVGASAAVREDQRDDRLLDTKGTKTERRTRSKAKGRQAERPSALLLVQSVAVTDALDDLTVAYIIESQPLFEDLRQVAAQLAGLLVLAATGAAQRRARPSDARRRGGPLQEALERIRQARPRNVLVRIATALTQAAGRSEPPSRRRATASAGRGRISIPC